VLHLLHCYVRFHCYANTVVFIVMKRHVFSLLRYRGILACDNIFKPTVGNESSHEISNDNGVRVVNFARSKNLVVKSTTFSHRSIHKYAWTSPDGQTHNQIDHVLIDRRRHPSILDVRSFRGADCDSDRCLVVAKNKGESGSEQATCKQDGYG
jgi:hypothetical protein